MAVVRNQDLNLRFAPNADSTVREAFNYIQDVVQRFESWDLLKSQDRTSFASSTYETLMHTINEIQSQQAMSNSLKNIRRIETFTQAMKEFEDTLEGLGFEHTPKAMAYIWGPVSFFLKATHQLDASKSLDDVLHLYKLIGANTPRFNNCERHFVELPEATAVLARVYEDLLDLNQQLYRLFSLRPNLWTKIQKSTWKAYEKTFPRLYDSLQSHKEFIEGLQQTLWNHQGTHLPNTTFSVQPHSVGTINDIRDHLDTSEDQRIRDKDNDSDVKSKQKEEVLKWLSESKQIKLLHESFQETRNIRPESGRWLFKNRSYSVLKDWMIENQPPESVVWIHGSKGFGKTILTSLLVDELSGNGHRALGIPEGSEVLFFYCQGDDPDYSTYLGILRELLRQFVTGSDILIPFCSAVACTDHGSSLSSEDAAETLIESFFQMEVRRYVVIDGLDECDPKEAEKLVKFLMKQVEDCESQIKQGILRVLFVSEKTSALSKDDLMPKEDARIELKPTDNSDDIRQYVKKKLKDFSEFNLLAAEQQQIENSICHHSKDMFLYARLAMDYLKEQSTKDEVLEASKEEMLPDKLSDMYENIIRQVRDNLQQGGGGNLWQMGRRLLGWLVCATRPLSMHEMQGILSYNHVQNDINFDGRMLRKDVQKYLGSLVQVLDGKYIRLVHSTARRYVITSSFVDEQEVQCELATLCLEYLSLPCFSSAITDEYRQTKARLGWFAFQDYACSKWQAHLDILLKHCGSLFTRPEPNEECAARLTRALDRFIGMHGNDLDGDNTDEDAVFKSMPHLQQLSQCGFYENLYILCAHIFAKDTKGDAIDTVGIAQIDSALAENRLTLEKHFFNPSMKIVNEDTVEDYYGPNLYKCKLVRCRLFHQGFNNRADREDHNNRHKRPYKCPESCSAGLHGFPTRKELDRHLRSWHTDLSGAPSGFDVQRRSTAEQRFYCDVCKNERGFTRKENLNSHMRSHFGEKPYECSRCQRSFTRLHELRRHEKTHQRRGI